MNTQVSWRRSGDAFILMGADRLSHGVMVANKDLITAINEVKKQLKVNLENDQMIRASVECTIPDDKLEEALKPLDQAFLLFTINQFGG